MHEDREACYRALRARDARFDGRIFVAVRTTGIYCRPICPARTPRLENVEFHASAAAAQAAGFRPCLRCRPETSPELAVWHGTSSTVRRALALIGEGALDGDDAGVERLALRLGIGARQLRRLFHRHLGASPVAVAQAQRLHFAVQLVRETGMRMIDVAAASGFGSLRRFNAAVRGLYGRPPSELRRQGASSSAALGAGAPITLELGYAPPYDWEAMAAFLAARAIPGIEAAGARCYRRTIELDGVHGSIEVAPCEGRHALAATIRFPNLRALPAIVARIRNLFDLGADTAKIAAALGEDAVLRPLVAARPGLRVPGAWDPFELAVRAVLGQQVSLAAARRLAGRLVAAYGERFVFADPAACPELAAVFPRPEVLAAADLTSLGMPRSRAATLTALAAAALAEPGLLAAGADLELAVARLCGLPGVGDWTAQYIAMRALREPDAFPSADLGLLRAAAGAGGRRPTPAELARRAEAWRPWRAYAAQHLWSAAAGTRRSPKHEHLEDVA